MTAAVLTGTFLSANVCSHADTFVDLAFKVDSKDYTSKSVKKTMDLAPFIEDGTTMVPFRTILEELGYVVEWQQSTNTILASNEANTIKLKINNKFAEVNGEKQELTVAPKIISSRTVVPLRFLSENSGATVAWDGTQKAIYISRVGKYDTGTVLFYEEAGSDSKSKSKSQTNDAQNTVYVYDGNEIITIPLEKRKIVNWYSYKGQILATIFDSSKNNNSFYIFKDNTFVPLLENFDIKDAFEFNDNLIIHGYDRSQKYDKLCRFDGQTFTVIQDNFYVGKYFIFKDRLVINKYDNSRNYTLLAFDKGSWNPSTLETGVIMSDYVIDGDISYMLGQRQEGSKKLLATYDGNSISKTSFNIVHDGLDITNIDDVVRFNGRFFVNLKGELTVVENKKLIKFIFQDTGVNVKYNTKLIKVFNNKLYVAVNKSGVAYDAYYKEIKKAKIVEDNKGCVFEIPSNYSASAPFVANEINYILLSKNSYEKRINNFEPASCMIENDKLLILGKDAETLDQVLYAKGLTVSSFNKIIDVSAINKSTSVGANSFLDVKDKNRITSSDRNTMLFYNGSSVSNLVVGMQTNKMTTLGSNLIFSGFESDIQRNKVYSYGTSFNEQLSNFDVNYWEIINKNTLFVNGIDKDTEVNKLYKFTDANKTFVKDYIYVNSIIKAKGNYYLIDAIDKDPNSYTKDKKVLYIYDEMNGKFIEMKVNLLITKMIFRN